MVQSFQEWVNSPERVNIFEREENIFKNEEKLFGTSQRIIDRHNRLFEARCQLFEEQFYNIPELNQEKLNESWAILENDNLNKLDEFQFTPALSRDEFLNESFPFLNESVLNETIDEDIKDHIYALYESQLFATHKGDWLKRKPKRGVIPVLLETDTHKIIFYDSDAFAISKSTYEILVNGTLFEAEGEEEPAWWEKALKTVGNTLGDGWDAVKGVAVDAYNGISDFIESGAKWVKGAGETIWNGITYAYDKVSDVVSQGIEKLGDWAKSLADAAKSVVGFLATAYEAVKAFIGNVDWLSMVNTLATIFRAIFGTIGSIIAPGLATVAGSVIQAATGIVGLFVGYERISEPLKQVTGSIKNAKTPKELGDSVVKMAPSILSGASALLVGGKDVIGAIASPMSAMQGITAISELLAGEQDKKTQETGKSIFQPKNAEAIGTILGTLGAGNFSSVKESSEIYEAKKGKSGAKSSQPTETKSEDSDSFGSIATMGGVICVEYLLPQSYKTFVKSTAPSIANNLNKALDLPKKAKEVLNGVGKKSEKEEKSAVSIIKKALGFITTPIVSGLQTFCDTVKPVVQSCTSPITNIPKVMDNTLSLIEEKITGIAKTEIEIPVMKEIETSAKKLIFKKEDVAIIKKESKNIGSDTKKIVDDKKKQDKLASKNKKNKKGKNVSESQCVDYETWLNYNF